MRVLLYGSTGFFEERVDPDFRSEWAREGTALVRALVPATPAARLGEPLVAGVRGAAPARPDGRVGGRRHLRRLRVRPGRLDPAPRLPGRSPSIRGTPVRLRRLRGFAGAHLRRGEAPGRHPEAARRRGRCAAGGRPEVYDYLWVGEGVGTPTACGRRSGSCVVRRPCIDQAFARSRTRTNRTCMPSRTCSSRSSRRASPSPAGAPRSPASPTSPGDDFWMKRCREIRHHFRAHPEGPHTSPISDRFPAARRRGPIHAHWLARYLPLVEEGTWASLESATRASSRSPCLRIP